jgi:hypothetical protein
MALRLRTLLAAALLAAWSVSWSLPAGLLRPAHSQDPPGSPAAHAPAAADTKEEPPELDPLSANGACYICHMTFVKEDLAKVHLAAKISCADCHGLSDKHANDEDIGATKPDIVYPRDKVDASCLKCHEEHDAPAAQVVARFLERKLPLQTAAICTECHGTHKIDRSAETALGVR